MTAWGALASFTKTPDEVLDYDVEFHRWLSESDTVMSAQAAIEAGTSVVVDNVEVALQVVKIWLSGGEVGDLAAIVVTAETAHGRTKQVSFRLRIRERR